LTEPEKLPHASRVQADQHLTEPAPQPARVPTGHPLAFLFFFWGEFAERCSYYGMRAILALYMTDRLGVSEGNAGTYMSFFIAACYFFPLIGGWVADRFLGKYWTIVLFSAPYILGQFLVGIENPYVVAGALTLLAMGSGVIKPNISTLMGITYDQQRPGRDQLRTQAFNLFYMAINIGALISQVAMPWLRTNYGYQVAFLFPAGFMALALLIFALGKFAYGKESIVRPVVDAPGSDCPPTKTITGIPVTYKVITREEAEAEKILRRKTLLNIGALFLTVMFFWAIFDQSASTWIFFAKSYMDCRVFGLTVTPDQIQATNAGFIVLLVPVNLLFFWLLARAEIHVRPTTKIFVGYGLVALSMFVMSLAGYLAGEPIPTIKMTAYEGEFMLPRPVGANSLSEAKPDAEGRVAINFDSVKLEATGWNYDEKMRTASFTGGRISLPDGKIAVIEGGRIDFEKSNLLSGSSLTMPGAINWTYKPAEYKSAQGKIVVTANNAAEEVPGELPASPAGAPAESGKLTLAESSLVPESGKVTVWWKILAFFIITVGEILISVTGLELAFTAAPASMKSFVTACWLAVVFLANLLINAPVSQLYPLMHPALYFGMMAVAMIVVMLVFVPIAAKFNKTMAEKQPE